MTTSAAAIKASERAWQAGDASGWLALAASPTFGLMAWIAANDASPVALCASASSIGGMTTMYVLMSLFHVSPWLKLAFGARGRAPDRQSEETDHEPYDRFARRVA